MPDKIAASCGDIHKNPQSFLEDLLSEEEYGGFIAHLDICPACERYLRSFGDLSNQIWKLGQIEPPSGFGDSILFKLKHPEVKIKPERARASGRWAVAAGVVILALTGLFFVFKPPKSRASLPEIKAPSAGVESIPVTESFHPPEARPPIVSAAPPPEPRVSMPAAPPDGGSAYFENNRPAPEELSSASPKTRHWHVIYSQEIENRLSENQKRQKMLRLNEQARKLKALQAEINRTEGRSSSDKAKDEERVKEIRTEINEIENSDLEFKRGLEDQKKKEISGRQNLLDMINSDGAQTISQPSDLVLFSASGKQAEQVLEHILTATQESGAFQDFTGGAGASSPDENQPVSVYFDRRGSSPLHWHIRLSETAKKDRVFAAIGELGGSVQYDSNDLAVISVPKTEIQKLRLRLEAMQLDVTEFGSSGAAANVLSNAPVTISINWV